MEKSPEEFVAAAKDEEQNTVAQSTRRNLLRRCLFYCAPLFVVLIIVFVILMLTVFRPRDPIFRINNVSIMKMELINGTTPKPGTNATIIWDLSVENRNFVSFEHPSTTATIYYGGAVIAEAHLPPGKQTARRTLRTNATMEVIVDRLLSAPRLDSDIKSGLLTGSGSSLMRGRAKIIFIKIHVRVKSNCTATVNLTSLTVLHQKCKNKFKLF